MHIKHLAQCQQYQSRARSPPARDRGILRNDNKLELSIFPFGPAQFLAVVGTSQWSAEWMDSKGMNMATENY